MPTHFTRGGVTIPLSTTQRVEWLLRNRHYGVTADTSAVCLHISPASRSCEPRFSTSQPVFSRLICSSSTAPTRSPTVRLVVPTLASPLCVAQCVAAAAAPARSSLAAGSTARVRSHEPTSAQQSCRTPAETAPPRHHCARVNRARRHPGDARHRRRRHDRRSQSCPAVLSRTPVPARATSKTSSASVGRSEKTHPAYAPALRLWADRRA